MNIKKQVEVHYDEIIKILADLVSFNSIEREKTGNYPFGKEVAMCLNKAIEYADSFGFKTKNLDNYIGYAEIGSGEKLIGILGHLDIVPSGEGWSSDPFKLKIDNNKIYGRGVADDKGAVVASLIAMKIVNEMGIDINKRVRLIMGTNEETGSKGLKYYVEKEGHIDMGFTPDGAFPGVHGEKGMIAATFSCETSKIVNIYAGLATNIVPNLCEITLEKGVFNQRVLEEYFSENDLTAEFIEEGNLVTIKTHGKAAHASTPTLGINAITHTIVGLKQAGMQDDFIEFFNKYIGNETDGSLLNIATSDKYGSLTANVGVIRCENGAVNGTIDIRFPVTLASKQILEKLLVEREYGVVEYKKVSEPLYYPVDSPLVKKLLKAYQNVTNDLESKPMTMGGGTYARGIRNCIAFGCAFPNVDNQIHDANEFVGVDEIKLQTEIYVNAILELLKD
ncbi:MAG: Sapep family Mn(2+)-dependent dipeptidase [Anaerorhabdus sp.]